MFGYFKSILDRDPAARWWELPLYPSLYAVFAHRVSHFLWRLRIPFVPRFLSALSAFFTGIEIHPGARIGRNFFVDHGQGTVIGETTEIGDNVTIFQQVTLGGTGKEKGKRHPTLRDHVVVAAGAKVLGNIEIGEYSKVGANAVVVIPVPPHSTVVGVPGRVVTLRGRRMEGHELDHQSLPDPLLRRLEHLERDLARHAGSYAPRKKKK
ncbi:MAG TPA: serine O-acetyltransferase [bacterium]|nr:serine O-acetyltransferase [bacterium]